MEIIIRSIDYKGSILRVICKIIDNIILAPLLSHPSRCHRLAIYLKDSPARGFQRAPAACNKSEQHSTVNAIKSPAADAPIANVKQEKCRTRLKVGRVDKESEARRGLASRAFFRQLLSAQLCRLVSSLARCKSAPFGIQASTPTPI